MSAPGNVEEGSNRSKRQTSREEHKFGRGGPSPLMFRTSASLSSSLLDLGLDEHGEVIERLLPAEIAGLEGDGPRQALLDDIDLGADRHRLQGDGSDHLAGQVRILEAIRVADQLIWNEIEVLAAEGVSPSRGEICER